VNFFSVPALIKRAIAKLQQVSSSNDFFDLVTQEVRQLTGFDRVMVYQFDPQGAGEVIAEAKNDDLPPYLRLHYPATDIPQPVRELYTQGLLRFIPDLSVPGVDLLPAENPVTQQPLDLGMAVLRGVDPCCVEYHQNIGVAAILVIALIRDRQLWGLIACHHHTSKYIPYEIREGCELLGQFVSSELASDELARINQELERSNQELDSFAYAASHDLKEPLRGIHNFSTLLLKGYESVLDDTGKARLQTLLRLTRRMESLIDALLKFSRLGQAQLNIQPTDLNELVNQVLEDLHISRQDVQLDIRIPRPLPVVRCDSILMSEVFTNLLSNACKYNDKPEAWIEIGYLEEDTGKRGRGDAGNLYDQVSASPRLSLSASSSQSPLTFYVKDNGIGIRERHLETVFRLFKRLHEQHLYGGGTGAGLTIAKKIIERHGGVIWVESIYGEGSTFYFTLPSY
jgi:light-regulated signal transduction histidine kinase (bacteriophytochrome)